ncbi:hypothetical protein BY996DRAFT_6415171 [Phakopsora pachyrhizi]|nr:hypothetical protein BY996DRAFT_6415171 [Phakopsora pachyrhizi]
MTEYAEHKEKTIELMRPNLTVMDLNIAAALYFATQWIGSRQLNTQKGFLGTSVTYRTPAQVLISGLESCTLPKQAIQFGAQSARLDENSKGQDNINKDYRHNLT